MARYAATVESERPQPEAFAYLADFTNAVHWDPSTEEATRIDDRTFQLVVRFLGRAVPLTYRVVELDKPNRVVFDVEGDRVRGRDSITVEPVGPGSCVRYDAEVHVTGLLGRLAEPVLALAFHRAAAAAATGIRRQLTS